MVTEPQPTGQDGQDADPEQLERSARAIGDAKAAAGRVVQDETIDTADLPTGAENVPDADAAEIDEADDPAERSEHRGDA
jgi:hypothetical protein